MGSHRIRVRPPGVKPWTRIGPLGPFRGRLGLAWVLAPLVLGVVLVVAVWLLLFRQGAPGGSYRRIGPEGAFAEGAAAPTGLPGVFVARTGGQLFAVSSDAGCRVRITKHGFVDCRGFNYGLDGEGTGRALDLLPLVVYRGQVYVDPEHPVERSSA